MTPGDVPDGVVFGGVDGDGDGDVGVGVDAGAPGSLTMIVGGS